MSVVGGEPKKKANPSYKATKPFTVLMNSGVHSLP